MKKPFIIIFIFSIQNILSQNFTYGPIVGPNIIHIEVKHRDGQTLLGGSNRCGVNIGAFGDYQLNNEFGLNAQLLFNFANDYTSYYIIRNNYTYHSENIQINTLQLNTSFKYDLNREYNKGAYSLVGLNFTNIISANPKREDNITDEFYKNNSIGLLIGLGTTRPKLNFEIVTQIGLSNLLKNSTEKTKVFGVFVNFSRAL